MNRFFPSMQKVYDRLNALAAKDVMTEAERIEEQDLSRTFWDMRSLNEFLQHGPRFFANGTMEESEESTLKARVISLAHYQTSII